MSTTTPYTPLECLLLFQSLVAFGTEDRSFGRIADLLANNDLVKGGETYDADRLTSDALRDLYLQLLSDELRSAEDGNQDSTQPGSKKRKIQGAALPTLKEAQEHKEKLPILIERLYARYRDYMVREIRADEREYARIKNDISEIERGEWDERILKEDGEAGAANGTASPAPSQQAANGAVPVAPIQEEKQPEAVEVVPETAPTKSSVPPVPSAEKAEQLAAGEIANGQQKTPVPPPTEERTNSFECATEHSSEEAKGRREWRVTRTCPDSSATTRNGIQMGASIPSRAASPTTSLPVPAKLSISTTTVQRAAISPTAVRSSSTRNFPTTAWTASATSSRTFISHECSTSTSGSSTTPKCCEATVRLSRSASRCFGRHCWSAIPGNFRIPSSAAINASSAWRVSSTVSASTTAESSRQGPTTTTVEPAICPAVSGNTATICPPTSKSTAAIPASAKSYSYRE